MEPARAFKFSSCAPAEEQSLIAGPVVLEDASAIGLHSVVLPGSTVGRNTWVAVGSVVRGALPPDSIAGGDPAVVLRPRFECPAI